MTLLNDYKQFDGLHWETGTVRNYLDYVGVKAPHTGEPFSEAMLMGIGGGAVIGYFSFAYKGYDPMARLLTRNTFNPWDTMLSRLGIVQDVKHTAKPEKGVANLLAVLDNGVPAIVWADHHSLTYNNYPHDDGMWGMYPIVVYGYDEDNDVVHIADRARVPLTTTVDNLAFARGRVKKDKHRVMTLEPPMAEKLASAIQSGIWDTIKLYTEKPPKGSKNNFGLAAYLHWIKLLTKPKTRMSWEKEFPAGRAMFSGLSTQYEDINLYGKDGKAERDTYATFLEEASVALNKPALKEVGVQFRASGQAWDAFSKMLLPDSHPLLSEARRLFDQRHQLFLNQGGQSLAERERISVRLNEIRDSLSEDFGLSEAEVIAFRDGLAAQVQVIHDIEAAAVDTLKAAM